MKDKSHPRLTCTAVTPMSPSAHPSVDYNQGTVYRAAHQLQGIRDDIGTVGISQSLHHVGPTKAHTATKRTPYTSFSGPIESI